MPQSQFLVMFISVSVGWEGSENELSYCYANSDRTRGGFGKCMRGQVRD